MSAFPPPPPHPPSRAHVPRQPHGLQSWPGWQPPGPLPVRPARAWYGLVVALLFGALAVSGLGVAVGLFLQAGKVLACDTTTACEKTPYEEGYRDPEWPMWPFATAVVLGLAGLLVFVALFTARHRNRRRQQRVD